MFENLIDVQLNDGSHWRGEMAELVEGARLESE